MMVHSNDPRKNPGIKRPYLNLPDTLEGEQSFCITIPGGLSNKLVLIDLLGTAALWFNWQRTEGTEAKQTADAWRDLLNLPELNMCCCNDQIVLHRVGENGALEISTDDGATWTPDPDDPRINGTSAPNTVPGTGTGKRCNAATNAINNFKDAQASFGVSLTTTTSVLGLAAAIAGEIIVLLLSAGTLAEVLVPLLITTATTLFGVLEVDYNAEFTEAVWDTLLCDLFCTIGTDGQFTEAQLIELQALVDTDFSGNVALTFQSILTGWGTIGLNNACIIGTAATADCSECDCIPPCERPEDFFFLGTPTNVTYNMDGSITVRVDSEDNGAGTQAVNWGDAVAGSECCCLTAFSVISGSGGVPQFTFKDCSSVISSGDTFAPGDMLGINYFQDFALSTPFTVDITFLGAGC